MRRLFQKIFRCCLAVAALPLGVLLASPASAGGVKDDLIREQFALSPETVEALKNRCDDTSTGTECLRLLRTIYATPRALDTGTLGRTKSQNIRNMLAEMIVSRQNAVLPEGAIPARFRPLGNGSLVHLEPQVALSPGVTSPRGPPGAHPPDRDFIAGTRALRRRVVKAPLGIPAGSRAIRSNNVAIDR